MGAIDEFYAGRDQASGSYGLNESIFTTPVGVSVGDDAAESPNGQFVVLSLVNMLSRIHRSISIKTSKSPLLIENPIVKGADLHGAITKLANSLNPFIDLRLGDHPKGCPSVSIGLCSPDDCTWNISSSVWVATLSKSPKPFTFNDQPSPGGAMVAALAAAAILRQILGKSPVPAIISAWDFTEGNEANEGPVDICPLDVGKVLMVGAGGVGCCLAYWLSHFKKTGHWLVVDKDMVELSNTNRCLGFTAEDAGWPGKTPRAKSVVAAELFGAEPVEKWYHDLDDDSFKPDLVLPLANEHRVRQFITQRAEPIILHSTTAQSWTSQLHRHIPSKDGCMPCRFPSAPTSAEFKCSTTKLALPGGQSTDAALPFLSSTSALLLYSALYRLMAGALPLDERNMWSIDFMSNGKMSRSSTCKCVEGCGLTLAASARRKVNLNSRWKHCDPCMTDDGETILGH
jgi:hypothetical protein